MKQNWKKNAAIFVGSQVLSLFGSSLVQYAITWHITLTTKSGVYATLIIVCGILPIFFLAPFAGVWADRYNRKLLIVLADAGIALCTLILAILFMSGYNAVWLIFVASGIRALGSAVQYPAVGAMLPDLVPEEQLTRVNGIYSSLQSLITLVSPMLSGALLSMASIESVFFVDVSTAAIAIVVMLTFLQVPTRPGDTRRSSGDYLQELRLGIRYIGGQRYLRSFFAFCAVFLFMATPVAFLTPLQTARTFGGGVWQLTAVEFTFSLGMMVGGLIMAAWGGLKNRVHTIALSGFAMGITTIALGVPRNFVFYLIVMTGFGLSMPAFGTQSTVMLQERVHPNYMGRVFGVMTTINSGMMPLGMMVFGPLADKIKIEWILIATGAMIMLASLAMLMDKHLVEAGSRNNCPQDVSLENAK